MNVKLHTPKSLKMGSGMSSLKQFLLSLFATTVSIALTFGTAAIIDYNKKQSEKREIVMMVMYDMHNSLAMIQKCDSLISETVLLQREIAEDTTKYGFREVVQLGHMIPRADYTETTERIFSSNIETINTVGNVLFTETVAEFYRDRKEYKALVCDSVEHYLFSVGSLNSAKNFLQLNYLDFSIISLNIKLVMQQLFAQCQQMMDVSDEDMAAYHVEREELWKSIPFDYEAKKKKQNEYFQLFHEIDSFKVKWNLN